MITIPHKKGIISKSNIKKIPKKFVGKHSNGKEWIYFITQEEKEDFYKENFPEIKPPIVKKENPLINSIKDMTFEEKIELKKLLLG